MSIDSNSCGNYSYDWCPQEILFILDSVTPFGIDPFALAVVIESRTFAEVAAGMKILIK